MYKGADERAERNKKIAVMFDELPGNITQRVRYISDNTKMSEPMIRIILRNEGKIGRV